MPTGKWLARWLIGVTAAAAVVVGGAGPSVGDDAAGEKGVGGGARSESPATRPTGPASPAARPTTQPVAGNLPNGPAYRGPREWGSYEAMHQYFVDRFINSDGFGYERIATPRQLARSNWLYHDGEFYRIGRVDLISLGGGGKEGGGKPFAYTTPRDAMKETLKKAEHRDLGEFEASALAQLKEGKQAVVGGDPGSPVMVGAVRATEGCIKCHSVKEGELLGAFAYPLKAMERTPGKP